MTTARPLPSLRSSLTVALLATFVALPGLASAQASGSVVIVVEGTITAGPAAAPAPVAPAPPVVEVAPQVLAAPVPVIVASPPSGYAPVPSGVVAGGPVYEPSPDTTDAAPRTRRRWGLVGAGVGMAVGAWALNIGGTVLALAWPFSNGHRDQLFFSSLVPVVGPMMQIGFRDGDWQIPFYVASSALQIAGWVMAFVGTFDRVEVETDLASMTVLPYASSDGAGVTLGGTF